MVEPTRILGMVGLSALLWCGAMSWADGIERLGHRIHRPPSYQLTVVPTGGGTGIWAAWLAGAGDELACHHVPGRVELTATTPTVIPLALVAEDPASPQGGRGRG